MARQETFIGTPDECVAQIRELAATFPIDPILVRAQWPHMSSDQVVAYLDDLGRDIVPAVAEHRVGRPGGPLPPRRDDAVRPSSSAATSALVVPQLGEDLPGCAAPGAGGGRRAPASRCG